MEITQVRVYPIDEQKLKGFASIVFDDCFLVSDIKIISGREGFFVSMPSKRKRNGQFKDIAHPITREMRQAIEDQVFSEYEKVTGQTISTRGAVTDEPISYSEFQQESGPEEIQAEETTIE